MRASLVLSLALAAGLAASLPSAAQAPADGAKLFAQNCSACHQLTGKGIPGAFPALAGDVLVQGPAIGPAKVVINGRGGMPTFKAELSNQQIAAILTYVRSSWGNHAPAVTPAIVSQARGGGDLAKASGAMQAH
ncbi:MAG: c-type cytochrome [Caulobacteraceae bacterium]